jgi:heat-inducible transcriptional repressor
MTTRRALIILITSTGRIEQRVVETEHTDDDLTRLRALLTAAAVGHASAQAAARLGQLLAELPAAISPLARSAIATLLDILGNDASSRVVIGGMPNLTRFGDEFETTVRPVLEALEEQVVLLKLLGEANSTDVVTVRIGRENPYQELQTTSVVASGYGTAVDSWATLGIVGPTRMDYPSTIASVRAVARYVGRFLADG